MSGRIWHITGARPNFPKAAPVIAALGALHMPQCLVHTGQHYDDNMSEVFFSQLGIPRPDVNLGVGSGTHAEQTARIMTALETRFLSDRPRLVVVYGDVNSTVAAALTAAKRRIPVAHVEAGLRSFDMSMPEEVNRIVTDRLCDLLLVTSPEAIGHLAREGVAQERIVFTGNPMIDTLLSHRERFDDGGLLTQLGIAGDYCVATLHRPSNVDDPHAIKILVEALHRVSDRLPLIMPVHPRGRERLSAAGLFEHEQVFALEPLGYLQFMGLVASAKFVVTDSGGIQEETTTLGVPCLTLRPNTERPITITSGTNRLTRPEDLADEVDRLLRRDPAQDWPTPPLWDGHAGERIAAAITEFIESEDRTTSR